MHAAFCVLYGRHMRGYGVFAVLFALLVVTGVCAIAEGPASSHVGSVETCCGLAHCSVVAGSIASIGLWVVTLQILGSALAAIRVDAHRPLSPPPERSLLPS